MPEIRDWWQKEFQEDQDTKKTVRMRSGRSGSPGLGVQKRPRNRSPDPCEGIVKYAERLLRREEIPSSPLPKPEPRLLRHLAHVCLERSELLEDQAESRCAVALIALSTHWRQWLRPADAWEPRGEGVREQFGSLARHLLARYDVPVFLDSAWFAGLTPDGVQHQGWFQHIGRGENIRTAEDLPTPLTKGMAHHFLQAPAGIGIREALRYAQVLGMGGNEHLALSILVTRVGTDFTRDDFWLPVIRWLIAHQTLDPLHHGPIIDYLYDQKFVPSVANPRSRRRGQPRETPLVPPQPNLSMTGRTPESLLRCVEAWHKELGSRRLGASARWSPSNMAPFVYEEGSGTDRKLYEISELICSDELEEEGKAMGHCVATYWRLCESGQASIWSLSVEDASGRVERLLTVEVWNGDRRIVQARGKMNRLPSVDELDLLARWQDSGGPTVPPPIDELPVAL
jgi:hypothetical protein